MTLNYDENHLEQEFECYAAIALIKETFQELEDLMAADLSTAVRTVSGGIDALKKLADVAVKSRNVELQEGILELREQLLSIKESLLEAKEENSQLREENKTLQEKLTRLEQGPEEKLTPKAHGYYKENGEGPFCIACYDTQKKLYRVIQPFADFGAPEIYKCSVCERNC